MYVKRASDSIYIRNEDTHCFWKAVTQETIMKWFKKAVITSEAQRADIAILMIHLKIFNRA